MRPRALIRACLIVWLAIAPATTLLAAPAVSDIARHHYDRQNQNESLMRVVQVDLDYVHDADPAQTERNLDALIDRLRRLNVSAVFLQAFADPNGTGLASAAYFPNRYLPLRDDLMRHAAMRLQQEAHVKVLGWLPVLSFNLTDDLTRVQRWNQETQQVDTDPKAYHRLSPFDEAARQAVIDIYTDMARQVPLDGILFHDDAMLSDYEDASPAAIDAYKQAGFADSIPAIRADADVFARWTNYKTDALINLTRDIAARMRRENPHLITVRNIYAPLLTDRESRDWFAQDYDKFLNAYDYVAVEAMPRMEKIASDEAGIWLQRLVVTASERAHGLPRTIFEFQAVDWNKQQAGENRAIPTEELAGQMQLVASLGGKNFGYYPDDFAANTPDVNLLRPAFSPQAQKSTP